MSGKFSRRHFAKLAGLVRARNGGNAGDSADARRNRQPTGTPRPVFPRASCGAPPRRPIRSKAPSMKTAAAARSGTSLRTRRARSRTIRNGDRANDHYHRYKEDVRPDQGSRRQGLSVFDRVAAGISRRNGRAEPQRSRLLQPPDRRTPGQRHRALCHAVSLGPAAVAAGPRRRLAIQRHLQGVRGLRRLCRGASDAIASRTSSRSTRPAVSSISAMAGASTRPASNCRRPN